MKNKTQNPELLNISEVSPFSKKDEKCFQEMKRVLKKHNSLNRFGICLLHKHFDLFEGEILVERCDVKNRRLIITPVKKHTASQNKLIATNWSLNTSKTKMSCQVSCALAYCLEEDNGKHSYVHEKETK